MQYVLHTTDFKVLLYYYWNMNYVSSIAPSSPRDITVMSINATAVNITWSEPAMTNGIVRNYTIIVLTSDHHVVRMTHSMDITDLTIMIVGLTHNTDYIVNISAWTVRQGEHGSLSFTTNTCKNHL